MTTDERILHYLGLATVSKNSVTGIDKTLAALKRNRLKLAVFASDGERTAEKARRNCVEEGVPVVDGRFDKLTLGHAIGQNAVTVVGIKDKGLANAILKLVAAEAE